MTHPALTAAALALALAAPLAAPAQDLDERRVKELALEAILENPGIVMEAVELLRRQEAEAARAEAEATVGDVQAALMDAENAPVIGNPEGDVTVVEFFDYNCPYCRRAYGVVKDVIAGDPELRVVMREWPILGDGSVFAARAALAAREQGLYAELHDAMMGAGGRLGEAEVMRLAAEVGLDEGRLRADMDSARIDAHIAQSHALAQAMGFSGTPSFVVGEASAPGMIPAGQLREMIAAARR
jgi:protein-disulfide isomerase